MVIDRLTIFTDGIAVDTASSTDDSDLFLDDLAEWAKITLPKALVHGPRYYLSHIELKMSRRLEAYVPFFQPIGEKITNFLNSYGIKVPRYEATALNLYLDQSGKTNPQPGVFYIDHETRHSLQRGSLVFASAIEDARSHSVAKGVGELGRLFH